MRRRDGRQSTQARSIGPLLLLLGWLAAGCAAPAPPAAPSPAASPTPGTPESGRLPAAAVAPLPTPAKVRMGSVGSSVGDGPIYIALDRGYFGEVGLEVEDIRFDGATRMMAPLAAGQLDIAPAAITAGLFNAFARDIDVRIVADRGVLAPGYGYSGLVVRQVVWDSGAVRALADLRGRKVGVAGATAGSGFALTLGRGLEARGLSLADLDVVDVPYPETNAALSNGSVDAAMQVEPLLALGVANGLFSVQHWSDELDPDQQNAFILYTADFARAQREAGRRWMVAYLRAVRDYVDAFVKDRGRDEVVAILARHTAVKDVSLYQRMSPTYINPNGRLNARSLMDTQEWYATHGYIPQKVDVSALIDSQFVDYALGVLGEYR